MMLREIQAGSGYWSLNGAVQVIHPTGVVEVRLPNGKEIIVQPNQNAKLLRIGSDGTVKFE
jgi:hypothetical protein